MWSGRMRPQSETKCLKDEFGMIKHYVIARPPDHSNMLHYSEVVYRAIGTCGMWVGQSTKGIHWTAVQRTGQRGYEALSIHIHPYIQGISKICFSYCFKQCDSLIMITILCCKGLCISWLKSPDILPTWPLSSSWSLPVRLYVIAPLSTSVNCPISSRCFITDYLQQCGINIVVSPVRYSS